MNANKLKILIVDDEVEICEVIASHFKRRGFDVLIATCGKEAIDFTKSNSPQIMLLDKRMPDMDGTQALEKIREFNRDLKVIMVSADELDYETMGKIKVLHILAYLHKPVSMGELDTVVEKAALSSPLNNDFIKEVK